MIRRRIVIYLVLVVVALVWRFYYTGNKPPEIEELTKVFLREGDKAETVLFSVDGKVIHDLEENIEYKYEEHFRHIGSGVLEGTDGMKYDLQNFVRRFEREKDRLSETRLYIYQTDEDDDSSSFTILTKKVSRVGFGEIRFRYQEEYSNITGEAIGDTRSARTTDTSL